MSCKRVESNLIKQNCYVRDVVPPHDVRTVYKSDESYPILETKTVDNGIRDEISFKPYPITPEYVNSFADSCDISRDLASAATNVRHDANLGDVREAQKLASLSLSDIRRIISDLQEKAEKAGVDKNAVVNNLWAEDSSSATATTDSVKQSEAK